MFERASTVVAAAAQTGASMMEQLVPEITTHALSYLDYPSLCRLSMTNSLMRSAANDDNAWKALYHKDFTLEQDNVRPVNGWKAYYAATRAIVNLNAEFFNIIRERSLPAMGRLWLNADYVKCFHASSEDFTLEQDNVRPVNGWKAYYAATRAIVNLNAEFFNIIRERSLPAMGRLWLNADYVKCFHASSEVFTGYNAVMASWELAFNWEHDHEFQVQDVSVRVLTDMAWVTMKAIVDLGVDMDMEAGPFNITNVYEFHNGRWYMVHHHSSVSNGVGEQEIDIVL